MEYNYSQKQFDVVDDFLKSSKFINILEGSVRSGKTYIANLSWVLYVISSPYDTFLMSGESIDSLYRNVIKDIVVMLGDERAFYNKSAKGGAQLVINCNGVRKTCYCKGSNKANDEGKIRGITLGGWYADEITLHHKTFVHQALSRLSLSGAKCLWTTNPDSPFHYIKTDYIDKSDENKYGHWHFTLDDNLFISQEYKDNIKNAYAGVFYDRFILGLWVLAEGLIYDMFNKNHIIPTEDKVYSQYYVGCDYGTQNPMVFLLFGRSSNDNWVLVKEYYYDGRKKGRQKTDEEYYRDLEDFTGDLKITQLVIDPSATSFIATVRKYQKYAIRKAKNDVLKGIRNTSTILYRDKIKVNDCCKNTIQEFYSYIWDEKAIERGEDLPSKVNDHAMDAFRYFCNTIVAAAGSSVFK